MISFYNHGKLVKTERFLRKAHANFKNFNFDKYGEMGVAALAANTPFGDGTTATSWYYKVERSKDEIRLVWCNSNVNDGVSIAVILQYGHGTYNGGYVQGRDYINPALRPVFDQIADEIWKEVRTN